MRGKNVVMHWMFSHNWCITCRTVLSFTVFHLIFIGSLVVVLLYHNDSGGNKCFVLLPMVIRHFFARFTMGIHWNCQEITSIYTLILLNKVIPFIILAWAKWNMAIKTMFINPVQKINCWKSESLLLTPFTRFLSHNFLWCMISLKHNFHVGAEHYVFRYSRGWKRK